LTIPQVGNRSDLTAGHLHHSSIEFLFLDELIEKLRTRIPDSPLLAVLAPLIVDDNQLEKQASSYYAAIKSNPNLKDDERKVLSNVFIHFISQRFKHLDSQQFQKMIAQLTPIEETCVGKELIEKGIKTGIEKGIQTGIEKGIQTGIEKGIQTGIEKSTIAIKMILAGKIDQEIADLTELPLKTIQDMRKNLEN
jgi:predicted transposase YdaD